MPYSEMTREQLLDEIDRLNQKIEELEAYSSPIQDLPESERKFRSFMDNSPVVALSKDDQDRHVGGIGVDITQAKHGQTTSESILRRFHTVLSSLYGGVLLVTSDGGVEFVNQAFCDIFGLDEDPIELRGLTSSIMLEKSRNAYADQEAELARIRQIVSDNEPVKSEEIAFLNGRTCLRDFIPIVIEGIVYGRFWYHLDISDRKRMEQALRESENKFATAFRNSPVAICITSASEGEFFEVNDVFLKDTEFSRDEIIGHTLEESGLFVNSSDRDRLISMVTELGQAYDEAIRFRMKSGKQRVCSVSTNLITLGGRPHFLSSILDVTMLKEAMATLAESEERFRLAIATSPDAICITRESDGFYVEMNDAFSNMLGYSREEVSGKTSNQINVWKDPKDRDKIVELLRNQGSCHDQQFVFRRKDGSLFWGSVSASVMTHRGEGHVISITRDITDRIEAEQEKQKLQAQIFQSQKMESLGTLVGGIAHDFNNMLQIIIGYAEIIMDSIGSDKTLRRQLKTIIRTSRDGADLVTKLLAFGQQAQVFPRPVDLNDQIRNVIKFLSRTLPKHVDIDFNPSNEPTHIQTDPKQLEQILVNLAINASEAMPEGGKLNISTRRVTLEGDYLESHPGAKSGDYFLMRIVDSGNGMSNETLAKIFDPFFSTKQKGSTRGTGLGLSVVLGIVQQHRGLIECHSEPGVGTQFNIYFPVIEAAETVEPKHSQKITSQTGETILIVEDVPLIADMEKTLFEMAGYKVFQAANGREALEIFQKHWQKISVVILDLVMPVMSGKECLMELLKIDPSVKAIILSGYSREEELSRQVLPYVKGFVTKPCSKVELLKAARSAIHG